ncbi:MAG: DNA polymerase ligase N-terminal domain-containing protein [Candidatus Hydrothermarchaeales archaeon]
MLEEYHKKRDFKKTSEPKGEVKPSERGRIYVIQRHDATHLHYDLRLEDEGVLKSWAIPKEPPAVHGVKRLAVQTEDHPLNYASFEGVIPEGEYGAGRVEIWDCGTFDLLEKTSDKYIINIKGKRLNGPYALIRFKRSGDPKNCLFFKKKE